mgnify:CR=1 FL=1
MKKLVVLCSIVTMFSGCVQVSGTKTADGNLEFFAITDRGPNGDGPKVPASLISTGATGTVDAKFFPSPSFAPSVGIISVAVDRRQVFPAGIQEGK